MRITTKHGDQGSNNPPKLIRTLDRWVACLQAGQESPALEEQVKALFKDAMEVTAAREWIASTKRIRSWLDMKRIKDDALLQAVRRKDLTITEGKRLYLALTDSVREFDQIAELARAWSLTA